MGTKFFEDKKITIRKIAKADLKKLKLFQIFINTLVKEEAKLLMNKKATLKQEKEFLERMLSGSKKRTMAYIFAEYNKKIVGSTNIELDRWRRNHIGKFGITISQGYRGIGLGKYLMSEIIELAKKELKPSPKIIQLEVYVNNKPAIALYKKMGFKTVGKIPKQIQWKGKLIDEFIMQKYL